MAWARTASVLQVAGSRAARRRGGTSPGSAMLTVSRAGLPGLGAAARSRPRYAAVPAGVTSVTGPWAENSPSPPSRAGRPRAAGPRLEAGHAPRARDQPQPARTLGEQRLLPAAQVPQRQATSGEHLEVVGGVGADQHRHLAAGRARRRCRVVEVDDLARRQPLPGGPLGAVLRHAVAVAVAVPGERDRRRTGTPHASWRRSAAPAGAAPAVTASRAVATTAARRRGRGTAGTWRAPGDV